jgi:hypothetical protein
MYKSFLVTMQFCCYHVISLVGSRITSNYKISALELVLYTPRCIYWLSDVFIKEISFRVVRAKELFFLHIKDLRFQTSGLLFFSDRCSHVRVKQLILLHVAAID